MRLVRYIRGNERRIALQEGDRLVDPIEVDSAVPFLTAEMRRIVASMTLLVADPAACRALVEATRAAAAATGHRGSPLTGARITAPIDPRLILCGGSNYGDHNDEKAASPLKGKEAEFFLKSPTCVIDPGEPIVLDPRVTGKLDYETELAVVIGRPGRHIAEEDAHAHIFGYTILNDLTARDRQVRIEPDGFVWYELGKSKNFDCAAPLGPCIVTADEIGDPQRLAITTLVNGEIRQNGSTASMIRGVAALVAQFSTLLTLHPGTIISTGTPGGTAWASDPDLGGVSYDRDDIVRPRGYLRPGDVVECRIEGIGTLSNHVTLSTSAGM